MSAGSNESSNESIQIARQQKLLSPTQSVLWVNFALYMAFYRARSSERLKAAGEKLY